MRIKIERIKKLDEDVEMGIHLLQAETGAKELRFPRLIKEIKEAEPLTNAIFGYKKYLANLNPAYFRTRWISIYLFPLPIFIKIWL
jgi:hypothetical protein